VENFVFGFGSLINTKSRMSSDPEAADAVPVRVSSEVGYARAWNFQSPVARLTALGLEKVKEGNEAGEGKEGKEGPGGVGGVGGVGGGVNGIISPVFGAEGMAALDLREVGYARVAITANQLEATSWIAVPAGGNCKVWMYVPQLERPGGGGLMEPGVGLHYADLDYPILQTYIDVCLLGCLESGEGNAEEFIRSTVGWDGPWLNDRETPRRPWVHQPEAMKIDRLLQRTIPAHFQNRFLPEEMGARIVQQRMADRDRPAAGGAAAGGGGIAAVAVAAAAAERRTEVGETGPLVVPLGASEGTAGDGDGKDDVEDGEMGWRRMGGRDGGGGVTGCVV
jgi:hypothetical protein